MSKMRTIRLLTGLALAAGVFGCGSATNNDQGTAFTFYGYFTDVTCQTGLAGLIGPIGLDNENAGTVGIGGTNVAYAGLQNNLLSQGIRARRIFLRFFIEGASVQPPPTSIPVGLFMGPGGTNPNGSLPDNFGGGLGGEGSSGGGSEGESGVSLGCVGFPIIPADILEFINFNKNQMPDLPFLMRVEASVRGTTTAGDELDSNPLDVFVQFVQDNLISPTAGGGGESETTTSGGELFEEDFEGGNSDSQL